MKITEQFEEFEEPLQGSGGLDLTKLDRRKNGFKRAVESAAHTINKRSRQRAFYSYARQQPSLPRFKCLEDA